MTTVPNHINHSTCGGGGSWSRPTILVSMVGGGGGRIPSSSASSPSMAWSRSLRTSSWFFWYVSSSCLSYRTQQSGQLLTYLTMTQQSGQLMGLLTYLTMRLHSGLGLLIYLTMTHTQYQLMGSCTNLIWTQGSYQFVGSVTYCTPTGLNRLKYNKYKVLRITSINNLLIKYSQYYFHF